MLQEFYRLFFNLPFIHFSLIKNEPKTELASSAQLNQENPKLLPTNPPASPLDFQADTLIIILKTDSCKKI